MDSGQRTHLRLENSSSECVNEQSWIVYTQINWISRLNCYLLTNPTPQKKKKNLGNTWSLQIPQKIMRKLLFGKLHSTHNHGTGWSISPVRWDSLRSHTLYPLSHTLVRNYSIHSTTRGLSLQHFRSYGKRTGKKKLQYPTYGKTLNIRCPRDQRGAR